MRLKTQGDFKMERDTFNLILEEIEDMEKRHLPITLKCSGLIKTELIKIRDGDYIPRKEIIICQCCGGRTE